MCNGAVKMRKQAIICKDTGGDILWQPLELSLISPRMSPTTLGTSLPGDMLGILVRSPYGEFNHFPKNFPQDPQNSLLKECWGLRY